MMVTVPPPLWILKWGGLESSEQRQISLYGKTKKISFSCSTIFPFFFSDVCLNNFFGTFELFFCDSLFSSLFVSRFFQTFKCLQIFLEFFKGMFLYCFGTFIFCLNTFIGISLSYYGYY